MKDRIELLGAVRTLKWMNEGIELQGAHTYV